MDKALYIAMTGAKHNMRGQTSHANNLANSNTGGFKADFSQARSMPVYYGAGMPTRAYALAELGGTNLSSGTLDQTGRDLDVAIHGEGFIAVQGRDGQEAYTRAGSLDIDSQGILRTASGLMVLGNGGPINIPPAQKVEFGEDGTISVHAQGQTAAALVQIDRIKLVKPDLNTVSKGPDGLFHILSNPAGSTLPADANVKLIGGSLENSNVNAVQELTGLLTLARQYEMHVKMMSTVEKNSESAARLLQLNA
ncbi:MAG TPA: flagellar basal-body rod protein FlgF [Cellvibrionaceae bacterium]